MPTKYRIAYLAHSLRSDWNNGNAHFLRGLLRSVVALGHQVQIFELAANWSTQNLAQEPNGARSLATFHSTYPDLAITTYPADAGTDLWQQLLAKVDVVILHEWTTPEVIQILLSLRPICGFTLLFHDTHHRASSAPEEIDRLCISRFDGVIAFGNVLRDIYRTRFKIEHVWTLHEAADTTVFHPPGNNRTPQQEVVWIGNWGDDERSGEIREFLLDPAAASRSTRFTIYGVRYPEVGLHALAQAGVRYGGYLPNLDAPEVYARSRLTVHIPRREYATTMIGIPTIRVFEALGCGIPLISAPWQDAEQLFRPGDMTWVPDGATMQREIARLLAEPERASDQAARGLETILARHTCRHRALQLSAICDEVAQ